MIMDSDNQSMLHIAILSSPGIGHIIPSLVLGNRLAGVHNVKVTVFVITTAHSPTERQLLESSDLTSRLDIVGIPPVDISALLDANTKPLVQLCLLVRAALPGVRSALMKQCRRLDALVVDFFCTEALPMADELNLPKFVYVPTNARFTALAVYCPVLDREIVGQYVEQEKGLEIPGCKPVRPEDVVDPMLDRNDEQYREYLRLCVGFGMADGILMNTWEDVDPVSLKALKENETLSKVVGKPIYAIGPLTRNIEERDGDDDGMIMQWLDKQPRESVLYVSFGSGGTLSAEQITELAWGLELSEQRFIWVVRPPSMRSSDEAFFTTGQGADGTPNYLPEGFNTRTQNQGLVVPVWAEQTLILRHPSTGGFLSHCGWNSTLESIKNGVPIIAWPLYAEQRQNATLLTEELGVAIRPKKLPTKGIVSREEVKTLVKTMLQSKKGKEMRERVVKLKMSSEKAISIGGSSYNSMCEVLNAIEKRRDLKL
ncbi:PREDICTED: anthocyanidin 3-O-glucosyltransferase 5-like [Ipomoea nil]|uniref:anthocyanidin 3-O-glucosyltransferase 5-like n=1 Tax=Ipomoea nil TaxID=35883 RepID=UPI000901ADA8|nr:PREDICTED: anthocyanidin 3-O-glucosyltransferase 5-like [Ipomoea nil]